MQLQSTPSPIITFCNHHYLQSSSSSPSPSSPIVTISNQHHLRSTPSPIITISNQHQHHHHLQSTSTSSPSPITITITITNHLHLQLSPNSKNHLGCWPANTALVSYLWKEFKSHRAEDTFCQLPSMLVASITHPVLSLTVPFHVYLCIVHRHLSVSGMLRVSWRFGDLKWILVF